MQELKLNPPHGPSHVGFITLVSGAQNIKEKGWEGGTIFLAIPFRDLLQLANWKSPFEIVNNRTKWAIFQRYVKLLERKTNYVV